MSDFVTAKASFATDHNGIAVTISKGDILRSTNAIVKQCPDNFEPVGERVRLGGVEIEQATAAPGEKRGKAKK